MDILFLVEDANLRGGTELMTIKLMRALQAAGKDCKTLSIMPYTGDDDILSLSQEEYSYWLGKATCILNKLTFCKGSDRVLEQLIRKKIQEYQPAILVNQTYDIITALPVDLRVAQVFNWSIKGYEASLMSIIRKQGLIRRILSEFFERGRRARRHRMLSRVPKLVVLTEAAKGELKSLNEKVRDEQMTVIPDPLIMNEDSSIHSSLKNNNVSFVGRLSHEKGVMRLLRIWERICARLPEYTLTIYGEGGAKAEMEAFIIDHQLPRVIFKGFCNELKDIYTQTDLLLMTSDTEGFGMVLTEAMYYGVPCVSFDCPVSPKEIIADAGITVSCYDEEAFSERVIELLANRGLLLQLQQKAIIRARDFYMTTVLKKWNSMFYDKH